MIERRKLLLKAKQRAERLISRCSGAEATVRKLGEISVANSEPEHELPDNIREIHQDAKMLLEDVNEELAQLAGE